MPQVSLIKTKAAPTLIFPPKVFEELRYIVNKCPDEVGWLFTVDKTDEGNFIIGEVFTPPQTVHATEAEISAQEYLNWYNVLEEDGKEPAERLYGWGHSHVNMPVQPSTQDEEQFMAYGETCPFFIRTIHNKKGEIRVDIAMFEENLLYSNCNWEVQYTKLSDKHLEMLDGRLKMNVKKQAYRSPSYPMYGGQYGGKNNKSGNTYSSQHWTNKHLEKFKEEEDKRKKGNLDPDKSIMDYTQAELDAMEDKDYFALVYRDGIGY